MPRLVAVDLFPGRHLTIDGCRHRVMGFKDNGATVLLRRQEAPDGETEATHAISRAELCAKIVEESAVLNDDIEDPDIAADQPEINLSFLSIDRKLDWYHKMILIRGLLPYSKMSPRSGQFIRASERARHLLRWSKMHSGVESTKSWSDKTLNDDLRRWRRAGYALAALQVKGLQYRPAPRKDEKYVRSKPLIDQIRKEHPHWSYETVRRMLDLLLRRGITSYSGQSTTQDLDVDAAGMVTTE
jgi:hypothetical protein